MSLLSFVFVADAGNDRLSIPVSSSPSLLSVFPKLFILTQTRLATALLSLWHRFWKWSPGFYLIRIVSFVLVNNFRVTWRWTLSCLFFFFEQSLLLCIHNNVSVNNESVRICRVLRASLTVWQFLDHSGSFQNRTTGYHIFPFTGVMNMFSSFFVKKEFCIPVSWFKVWCLGNNLCEKHA